MRISRQKRQQVLGTVKHQMWPPFPMNQSALFVPSPHVPLPLSLALILPVLSLIPVGFALCILHFRAEVRGGFGMLSSLRGGIQPPPPLLCPSIVRSTGGGGHCHCPCNRLLMFLPLLSPKTRSDNAVTARSVLQHSRGPGCRGSGRSKDDGGRPKSMGEPCRFWAECPVSGLSSSILHEAKKMRAVGGWVAGRGGAVLHGAHTIRFSSGI